MIRSMTGFGRGEVTGQGVTVAVEARSVNHRHLDVVLRLPPTLSALEGPARRLVQSRLERGRVEVAVQLVRPAGQSAQQVRVDTALARRYLEEARALAAELGVPPEPSLSWLLDQPGVLVLEEAALPDAQVLEPLLLESVGKALDELVARRTTEGAGLASGLLGLAHELSAEVATMSGRAPVAAARRAERLRERVRALLGDVPVDEARILTEVAMWAQKTDITEELTRLRVHLDEFAQMLDKGGPVGRAFDFLIQELHREVNTVAAKADDLELSQAALAAKGIIEKMREQVQNLE
jgi:uncharacterized protein (TIGR00255 family)